jgi:hypothetical protein
MRKKQLYCEASRRSKIANRNDGTLAQLVEQRTFNPLVTSSNLVRPTTLIQKNQFNRTGFFLAFCCCVF